MYDSGQITYPLGLNFLIYEMGIYKKNIPQRIVVRINEVTYDMCFAFPGAQCMLNKVKSLYHYPVFYLIDDQESLCKG